MPTPEEEAMAAEWAAMAGGDADDDVAVADAPAGDDLDDAASPVLARESAGDSTRVLNQDEIDSLLGFDGNARNASDNSGIRAILDSALVSYERLPMLEVVFDRLVRLMSTSLRNFTSDNVEVSLDSISSIRFGDYLNSIPLPAIINVFKVEEWDNYGLLTVDSALIYSIVDVLLGGRRGTAAMRIEGRPYTTIERSLVERMVRVIMQDLTNAFEPLAPVHFKHDRLEINPRFATISRPANAAIVARLRIDMEDRGGRLELIFPNATLEPVRELLLQMFMGEKFGRDSIWETHLAGELWNTDVDIQAVLDSVTVNLRDVLEWKVGTQIRLSTTPENDVSLMCGDIPMFSGRMGRKAGHIAVRIGDKIEKGRGN